MITYRVVASYTEEQLERYGDKADEYVKHQAVQKFAEELVKHVEPKDIEERREYYGKTIIFTFDFTGGSLPDHMEKNL